MRFDYRENCTVHYNKNVMNAEKINIPKKPLQIRCNGRVVQAHHEDKLIELKINTSITTLQKHCNGQGNNTLQMRGI